MGTFVANVDPVKMLLNAGFYRGLMFSNTKSILSKTISSHFFLKRNRPAITFFYWVDDLVCIFVKPIDNALYLDFFMYFCVN